MTALAERAEALNWCRPALTEKTGLDIISGTSSVVEQIVQRHGDAFVPNDLTPR